MSSNAAKSKSERFKERYEQAQQAQAERQKRDKFNKRIQFAKKGKAAFGEHDFKTAVVNYETYLKILEESYNVGSGKLRPEMFDSQAEILLMAAIYWDLMRLFDRSPKCEDKYQSYKFSFTLFCKSYKWERVYRNNIRRYIRWGNPTHKEDFVAALKDLGGAPDRCFIATSCFGENANETIFLRRYRDQVLLKNGWGKAFIWCYYEFAPSVVFFLELFPGLKMPFRKSIQVFLKEVVLRDDFYGGDYPF